MPAATTPLYKSMKLPSDAPTDPGSGTAVTARLSMAWTARNSNGPKSPIPRARQAKYGIINSAVSLSAVKITTFTKTSGYLRKHSPPLLYSSIRCSAFRSIFFLSLMILNFTAIVMPIIAMRSTSALFRITSRMPREQMPFTAMPNRSSHLIRRLWLCTYGYFTITMTTPYTRTISWYTAASVRREKELWAKPNPSRVI